MCIKIGKFAKTFNQKSMIELIYQNEKNKVYSVKLPFRFFLCLTLKKTN